MKKFLSLAICMIAFCAVNAQSTAPRYGTAKNADASYRNLSLAYVSKTDAAGADSVIVTPSAFSTVYRLTLTDSLYFKSPTVTRSYAGDQYTIVASGASGNKVKFAGTNWISAGTATLSTSGRAVITFVFDGSKWVESARVVQ